MDVDYYENHILEVLYKGFIRDPTYRIKILLRLFSGIWYGSFHILTFLTYRFELFGILAGYIIFWYKNRVKQL